MSGYTVSPHFSGAFRLVDREEDVLFTFASSISLQLRVYRHPRRVGFSPPVWCWHLQYFPPIICLTAIPLCPTCQAMLKISCKKKINKNTRDGVCITQETAPWDFVLWTFVKLQIPTSVVCLSLPIGDEHLHQWQGHPKNHGGPHSEPDCHLQRQQPAGRRCQDHQCFLWYACLQHNSLNQISAVCRQHYSNLETISFLGGFFNDPRKSTKCWLLKSTMYQPAFWFLFGSGVFSAALLCRKQAGYWWLDDCVTASATSQLERILPVAFSFNLIAGASF